MAPNSVLSSTCDYHFFYLGCPNYRSYQTVDLVFIFLFSLVTAATLAVACVRFYQQRIVAKKTIKQYWNKLDSAVMCSLVSCIFRVAFVAHNRDYEPSTMSISDMQSYVKFTVSIDFLALSTGSLAVSFVFHFVVIHISKKDPYGPFQLSGRTYDFRGLIKLVRLVILLGNMILISLWLVYGLEDQHQYEFYRRFQNVFQGSMLLFVSAVLLYSRYLAAREMKLASVEKRRSLSQKSPRNSAVQELGKIKIDRWKLKLIKNKISTIYIIMGIDSIMHAVVDDLFPTSYNLLFIVKIVDDILLLLIPALGLYWFQHGIIRNLRAAQLAQVDVEQRTSETDRDIVDEKAPFSQYYQPQRYSDSKRGSMQTNAPSRFQSIMSLRMVADPMEDDILYLVDKGYTREQAIEALLLTKCNLKKAEMLLR